MYPDNRREGKDKRSERTSMLASPCWGKNLLVKNAG